jgi:hypothetical protein
MFSAPANNGVYKIVCSGFELVSRMNTQMIFLGSGPSWRGNIHMSNVILLMS